MKRIILSIFSVFITLGAAAETEQARPAMQQSETAADAETPSVTAESAAAPAERTAMPAAEQTSGNQLTADAFATPAPSPIAAEKQKRPKEQRFLPTRKRIDREINKLKFAYKGEVALGITASYGTISSDDTDMMLILDHINLDGTMAQVNPFVGYFYRDNNMVGLRLGYRHIGMGLGNLEVDLGSQNDLDISLDNMDYSGNAYSFGLFHRSYTGFDPKGSFGLFAELELSGMIGRSDFSYLSGDTPKSTHSKSFKMNISFNPGVAVYIFPNVCGTLSFGLGGFQYSKIDQTDQDGKTGSRTASKMRFRLNLANINVGMTVHLWNKKKE